MVIIETIDNILTLDEAEEIITFAKKKGMQRSTVKNFFNLVTPQRTSTNTFMKQSEFTESVDRISDLVAKKTGYPVANQSWQIVNYKPGQKYEVHHDGFGRMYTMYIYLNTVSEGGETEFPELRKKIKPVLGKGILWKNYTVEKWMGLGWMNKDIQATHAGLPPKQGEKWGLNVWIHDKKYWKSEHFNYSEKIRIFACYETCLLLLLVLLYLIIFRYI